MAKKNNQDDQLQKFAIIGVEAEIQRLNEMLTTLRNISSHIAPRGDIQVTQVTRARKGNRMSPAARKAIGERMRAYWAERRAAAAAKPPKPRKG